MRLEGKVALVSGGARGQGAAEARLFAKEGAKVVVGDVLVEEGARTAAEIAEDGGDAAFVYLDVTSEEDWRNAINEAVSRYGKLDVLVNNAGIWRGSMVEDTSVEEWDAVQEVNSKGVFLGSKHSIPEMRKAGGGSIINISSTAGLVGSIRSSAYAASKGSVRLLTKATAVQYGKDNIRANSIHPAAEIAEDAGGRLPVISYLDVTSEEDWPAKKRRQRDKDGPINEAVHRVTAKLYLMSSNESGICDEGSDGGGHVDGRMSDAVQEVNSKGVFLGSPAVAFDSGNEKG